MLHVKEPLNQLIFLSAGLAGYRMQGLGQIRCTPFFSTDLSPIPRQRSEARLTELYLVHFVGWIMILLASDINLYLKEETDGIGKNRIVIDIVSDHSPHPIGCYDQASVTVL